MAINDPSYNIVRACVRACARASARVGCLLTRARDRDKMNSCLVDCNSFVLTLLFGVLSKSSNNISLLAYIKKENLIRSEYVDRSPGVDLKNQIAKS